MLCLVGRLIIPFVFSLDFFDFSGFDSFSFGFFFDLENSLLRKELGFSTKKLKIIFMLKSTNNYEDFMWRLCT